MKGCVYVISNKGKPGLVKVGYSSKDPELRAKELDSTADPHPHVVDYEVLVVDPYKHEQIAHSRLSDKHEGKEWFRTSAEDAVYVIRSVAGNGIISEDFKIAKKEEVLRLQSEKKQQDILKTQKVAKENADRLHKEKDSLRKEKENSRREKIIKGSTKGLEIGLSGIISGAAEKKLGMLSFEEELKKSWLYGFLQLIFGTPKLQEYREIHSALLPRIDAKIGEFNKSMSMDSNWEKNTQKHRDRVMETFKGEVSKYLDKHY